MKKIYTILSIIILTSFNSFAQTQFGVKAGFNSSAIGTSESDINQSISAKTGFQFGGVATIPFSDKVQLRSGVIYNQKGYKVQTIYGEGTGAMDYLEVPVDFTFMLGSGGFGLSVGPYLAFLLSANAKADGQSQSFANDVKNIDAGLNFGTSFNIQETMIIDTRYGMGLTNISEGSDIYSDYIVLNGVFSISFSYMFGG